MTTIEAMYRQRRGTTKPNPELSEAERREVHERADAQAVESYELADQHTPLPSGWWKRVRDSVT